VANRITVQVVSELRVLIPRFLSNRRSDLESIENHLRQKEFDRVRVIGHDLRGVGGGYGFDRITELGCAIEAAAKQNDADSLARLLAQYREYLNEVDVVYV
jgi:HPt (histidine-containing phosphotransfer) domain-containing protein